LKQVPGIESISVSNRVPGQALNGFGIIPEGHRQEEHLLCNVLETDAGFATTFNIAVAQGRFFSPQLPTDTAEAVVINEAMARYLNWKEPVGKQFEIFQTRKAKVIGVVKDFNFASLRETIQPLAIILNNNPLYLSVKLKGDLGHSALQAMGDEWKRMNSQYPFDYFFMDEQLSRFYRTDIRLMQVLSIFAVLAIVIACMGLFGLSVYTARQRTKEIGIRKVLGASVSSITVLLSKDFMKLVGIASVISFPLAGWALTKWLQEFAFRIHIGAWIFGLAAMAAISIALITVSIQAVKAAMANPVKSLRTD
jgi:putative ABC transport system permease protein